MNEMRQIKKILDEEGVLDEFILRQENYKIGHDPYWEEKLQNYSEDEIVAFCSDDYTEGEVLMWLAEGINYDLICDCIDKHELWD